MPLKSQVELEAIGQCQDRYDRRNRGDRRGPHQQRSIDASSDFAGPGIGLVRLSSKLGFFVQPRLAARGRCRHRRIPVVCILNPHVSPLSVWLSNAIPFADHNSAPLVGLPAADARRRCCDGIAWRSSIGPAVEFVDDMTMAMGLIAVVVFLLMSQLTGLHRRFDVKHCQRRDVEHRHRPGP